VGLSGNGVRPSRRGVARLADRDQRLKRVEFVSSLFGESLRDEPLVFEVIELFSVTVRAAEVLLAPVLEVETLEPEKLGERRVPFPGAISQNPTHIQILERVDVIGAIDEERASGPVCVSWKEGIL
jgi:hypothetical protein